MRRSYVRFSADRKAIFLKALRQTGLVTLACDRAGIHRDTVYAHRSGDAAFAGLWAEAIAIHQRGQAAVVDERRRFVERLFSRPASSSLTACNPAAGPALQAGH